VNKTGRGLAVMGAVFIAIGVIAGFVMGWRYSGTPFALGTALPIGGYIGSQIERRRTRS
jgi:hypothetical protein